jgi:8-oxo-dGTP pyrophosphatase MutT (NUDIX family)
MEELSAGGVVVRDGQVVVIVPVRRDAQGRRVLGLPKGHPEAGEDPLGAALREVREEAGVEAELITELGEVNYSYLRENGQRRQKRVVFYLLRYRAGDPADHDHEIEEARWMPLERALEELTYAGEREMVRRALSRNASDR